MKDIFAVLCISILLKNNDKKDLEIRIMVIENLSN